MIHVSETFFSIGARDMQRAIDFYCGVFGASVKFQAPVWTSLVIAGVRVGIYPDRDHPGGRTGLHLAVDDLAAACAEVERAGGSVATPPAEVAPGVVVADVVDPEGNVLALRAV